MPSQLKGNSEKYEAKYYHSSRGCICTACQCVFSDWMNMSIGMLVHEASILFVIINGMRLVGYRLRT